MISVVTCPISRSVSQLVGPESVLWYSGKTADWIQMPFVVLSGVSRGIGVLDGMVIEERERTVLGVNVGSPIVNNGDLYAKLCRSA